MRLYPDEQKIIDLFEQIHEMKAPATPEVLEMHVSSKSSHVRGPRRSEQASKGWSKRPKPVEPLVFEESTATKPIFVLSKESEKKVHAEEDTTTKSKEETTKRPDYIAIDFSDDIIEQAPEVYTGCFEWPEFFAWLRELFKREDRVIDPLTNS